MDPLQVPIKSLQCEPTASHKVPSKQLLLVYQNSKNRNQNGRPSCLIFAKEVRERSQTLVMSR
jgi:hypothetical protein